MSVLTRITTIFLMLLLSGCSVQFKNARLLPDGRPYLAEMSPSMDKNIRELAGALMSLGPGIDPNEAREVAHDAYIYPLILANKWELTWPPMYHNTLRNADIRAGGLCTDWASSMIEFMRKKNLRSMDIYWGVAYKGDPWREHSTLLVTARGYPFDSGIILDPWRNSGKLYWLRHVDDPAYKWKYHAGPFKGNMPAMDAATARRLRLIP